MNRCYFHNQLLQPHEKFGGKCSIIHALNPWLGEGHRKVTPDDQNLLHKQRIEPSLYFYLILKHLHQSYHSALSRRRSRRIHHPKNILYPSRGGTVADGGWGPYKSTFPILHPPWWAPFLQGEGFPSLFDTVDSTTPGRNALRAEWHESEMVQWKKKPVHQRM